MNISNSPQPSSSMRNGTSFLAVLGSVGLKESGRRLTLLGPLGPERGMQLVQDLVEDGGRDGIAVVEDGVYLNVPLADGELAFSRSGIWTDDLRNEHCA